MTPTTTSQVSSSVPDSRGQIGERIAPAIGPIRVPRPPSTTHSSTRVEAPTPTAVGETIPS